MPIQLSETDINNREIGKDVPGDSLGMLLKSSRYNVGFK